MQRDLQRERARLQNWEIELEEADRRAKENSMRAKEAMNEARRMRTESMDLAAAIGVELDQRRGSNDTDAPQNTSASGLGKGSNPVNPQTASGLGHIPHGTGASPGLTQARMGSEPVVGSPGWQQWRGAGVQEQSWQQQQQQQQLRPPYQPPASSSSGFQPSPSPATPGLSAGYIAGGGLPISPPQGVDQRSSGGGLITNATSPQHGPIPPVGSSKVSCRIAFCYISFVLGRGITSLSSPLPPSLPPSLLSPSFPPPLPPPLPLPPPASSSLQLTPSHHPHPFTGLNNPP